MLHFLDLFHEWIDFESVFQKVSDFNIVSGNSNTNHVNDLQ